MANAAGNYSFFFSLNFDDPIIQPLEAWLKRYSTPKKMQKAKNSNIKRETPVHVNSFNTTLEEKSFWPDQGWPTWAKIRINRSKPRNRGCDYHTLNNPKKQDKNQKKCYLLNIPRSKKPIWDYTIDKKYTWPEKKSTEG